MTLILSKNRLIVLTVAYIKSQIHLRGNVHASTVRSSLIYRICPLRSAKLLLNRNRMLNFIILFLFTGIMEIIGSEPLAFSVTTDILK